MTSSLAASGSVVPVIELDAAPQLSFRAAACSAATAERSARPSEAVLTRSIDATWAALWLRPPPIPVRNMSTRSACGASAGRHPLSRSTSPRKYFVHSAARRAAKAALLPAAILAK